jgi:hypothetical protein
MNRSTADFPGAPDKQGASHLLSLAPQRQLKPTFIHHMPAGRS